MGRTKKVEEKAKEGATLQIDVDSFVRTRDSVVTGLATLQDAIQTLSSAYIKHTNAVLGEHGAGLDVDTALAKLVENPLLRMSTLDRAVTPAAAAAAVPAVAGEPDKKERKKRTHDPNAPKRPLTPFFLYMQTARPIIADDLGPEAAKGAVSAEGTRRWTVMEAPDKQLWTHAYRENLRLYHARVHSYKQGGNADAKDMTDEEAARYADAHNIHGPDVALLDPAIALLDDDADVEADADADAEPDAAPAPAPEPEPTPSPPPPPPKTPKAKNARRARASKTATPAVPASPEPPASAARRAPPPAPAPEPEPSPDKKRKRGSKKEESEKVAAAAAAAAEEAALATPKSAPKPRKKKAKGGD